MACGSLPWKFTTRARFSRASQITMKPLPPSPHIQGSTAFSAMAQATAASTALPPRSEEHTSELQSLMRISYAIFCVKKKNENTGDQLQTTNITSCTYLNNINSSTQHK